MNIFFLHPDPRICAMMHCDKHVVKMIVEATQLLYICHYLLGSPLHPTAYKSTHRKHPCALWLTQSIENYLWTIQLAWALADEYRFRYGQHKMHKCEIHLVWLENHIPIGIPHVKMTMPAMAMKDHYKCSSNAMISYRNYYLVSKHLERGFVKYTGRPWPDFLLQKATQETDCNVDCNQTESTHKSELHTN